MKEHLIKHGVWRQLEFLCASSNDKVQAAKTHANARTDRQPPVDESTQAAAAGGLCNLVTSPSIVDKILKQVGHRGARRTVHASQYEYPV
jgi:hypothetical protein